MSFRYKAKRALRSLSHDTKKCDTHVCNSFYQPLIRRKQLRKLTQHVRETTSEVSKQDVGETTEILAILLVDCQLSRDVIGYEDS